MADDSLDIKSKADFPSGSLSNFAAHDFVFDEVACASMEGFLQSLKVEDRQEQKRICALSGVDAQKAGQRHNWAVEGTLWWKGQPFDRLSDEYQGLLDRAYDALFTQARKFRDALEATEHANLTHRSGKADPCETILTEEEFCGRLLRLRARLKKP